MADKVDLKKEDFVFEDDSGDWKPLPAEITAQGGREPTAQELYPIEAVDPLTGQTINQKHKKFSELSPQEAEARGIPVSTITGHPEATAKEKLAAGKEAAATTMRYVPSIVAGIATGGMSIPEQLAIGGLTAGLSEITARQIERAGTDPELDSIWNDLKAGGAATAIDVAVGAVSHGLMRGVTAVGKRLLLPRSMPPDVELAQTILGKMKEPSVIRKWLNFKGKKDPFSLTLGQLNNEERGFITWLEGVARGGTGRGIMTKFDIRNANHVAEALDKYFSGRTAQMTGPEFGVFMRRILGEVDNPGEAFKPVEAFRAYLYKQFDDALEGVADATIDGSALRDFLIKSADPDLIKVFKQAKGVELLPALKDTAAWQSLPVQDAEKAMKVMNSFYSSTDEAFNKRLVFMRKKLEGPFDKFIESKPQLKNLRDTANSYFAQKQNALYNKTLESLRRNISRKPSGVAALLDPTKGNAAIKYDQLAKIKNALYFSAATPSVESAAGGIGRQNAIKMFEDDIIRPLRFRFVDSASDQFGRLNPAKLLKQIEKIEAEAPEMLHELWGSPTQVKYIKELASTYNTILTSTPEKSVFIQLKTAGAIGGAVGGAWSFFNGDSPTAGAITGGALGAAAVLISPNVLARVLANPRLTRALTDGLRSSGGGRGISTTLAMTFRKMSEMKAASSLFRDNPSSDVMQFYNFAPIEEVPPDESTQ